LSVSMGTNSGEKRGARDRRPGLRNLRRSCERSRIAGVFPAARPQTGQAGPADPRSVRATVPEGAGAGFGGGEGRARLADWRAAKREKPIDRF
jgi:hypothetical protein